MMRHTLVALALAAVCLGGCSQQEQQQTERSLESGAAQVGRTLEQGAEKLGNAVETGLDTGKLKSALMASEKLDTSNLDVDKQGNTFYLRGSVPSEEQKQLAGRLASDMVGTSEKVVNELMVGVATATASPSPEEATTVESTTRVETTTVAP